MSASRRTDALLTPQGAGRPYRDGVWWAGLVVAAAAAAATAHGLYAVAEASRVPLPVAGLYPVMADGLALVAYSATNRLTGGARRYAWAVVVAAAGLSGAAQAAYLAGGGVEAPSGAVRFGIGAAPAVAAAAVAHLLHLIRSAVTAEGPPDTPVQFAEAAVQPLDVVQVAVEDGRTRSAGTVDTVGGRPAVHGADATLDGGARPSAVQQAERAALDRLASHGWLPTTTELARLAGTSRGTAGTALKRLRAIRPEPPSQDSIRPERSHDEPAAAPGPDRSEPARHDHPTPVSSKIQNHHTPRHHDPEEDQLRGTPATGGARR